MEAAAVNIHDLCDTRTEKGGQPLLGQASLIQLNINWSRNKIDRHRELKQLKDVATHEGFFKSFAGCLSDVKVKLHTNSDSKP
ncbi:hypothetical protein RRG08_012837 [Elysia crispata]|uniref:Uncharacterized protein n=1 Tax=Elysia crispata TaxID=231223 RepID=A0AAE1EAU1_9GAST|nr:hypothetical protein RRG08_012837 [Elysia crispata]